MRIFLACLFLCVGSSCFCQEDNAGAGRALKFDGIDDYVDMGNIMDDLTVPFSVSAWIYLDEDVNAALPILVSQDNGPLYNGFWFFVNANSVWVEMGDGMGENLPNYRRGKMASVSTLRGRWFHVAAVVNQNYSINLYVNGIDVGGFDTGNSNLPMASMYPGDVAKIGYFISNGIVYRFRGMMDELRVWKRPLSQAEIRDGMCRKLPTNEPGLVANWAFNETSGTAIKDRSPNLSSGQLMGNPSRVFSGAPIGDESKYSYKTSWAGQSLTLDPITVSNVGGAPEGVHIYRVNSIPSQTVGLDANASSNPYHGVFTASLESEKTFDANINASCQAFRRADNSQPQWTVTNSLNGIIDRSELILASGVELSVALGPDQIICDRPSYVIVPAISNAVNQSFSWSNGETTKAVTVDKSGRYILRVSNSCSSVADTINVTLLHSPPAFTLGSDLLVCNQSSIKLQANIDMSTAYTAKWSTGETTESIIASSSGIYALELSNYCNRLSDTIKVNLNSPPIFSLGEDSWLCAFQPQLLQPFTTVPNGYQFTWQDGSHENSYSVDSFGTYWLTVNSACGTKTDTLHIKQRQNMGETIPNVITPNSDPFNEYFLVPEDKLAGTQVIVYSRWGQEVFRSENYKNNWNGTGLPTGIYFYSLTSECLGERHGTVTISR